MKRSIFYIVAQKTIVDKSIYKDNAKDFATEDEYFPLRIDNEQLFFHNIKFDDDMKTFIDVFEIKLGIEEIEFDDSVHQLAPLLGFETVAVCLSCGVAALVC